MFCPGARRARQSVHYHFVLGYDAYSSSYRNLFSIRNHFHRITPLMVWPYLFPAYGLHHLANSLEVDVRVPDWDQLIRAAVILTAKVEDLVSV